MTNTSAMSGVFMKTNTSNVRKSIIAEYHGAF
jgi:hypothetical protein